MLKKIFKKQFWFGEEEIAALRKKFLKSGLRSESELIRQLVLGYEPREKPDERFYEVMKELRAIGNNLNQIARKANYLGFIDQPFYQKEAVRWNDFMNRIYEEFLLPEKSKF